MRIGVVPFLDRQGGGIYQYTVTMLQALLIIKKDGFSDEFIIFSTNSNHPLIIELRKQDFQIISLEPSSIKEKLKHVIKTNIDEKWIFNTYSYLTGLSRIRHKKIDLNSIKRRDKIRNHFLSYKTDLIIYTAPTSLSFEVNIPYVMPIHDLQHRLQPEFPEVSADGEFEEREYLYSNGIKQATMILAESEVGKEDIIRFYDKDKKLNRNKIKILPYIPSFVDIKNNDEVGIKVREKFHLPKRYLFYPAAFWPHKNHLRIIKALDVINDKYKCKIPIVFCGSYIGKYRKESYDEVRETAKKFSIETYYLDYVKDSDLVGLYTGAEALVMPTFFGPTNIPVIEAWVVGCPVITSDIRGIREQVGDAALLVDPKNEKDIARGIYKLWTDGKLRKNLISKGKMKVKSYSFDDYCRRLQSLIDEAKACIEYNNK
ncbi:hypothetical protein COV53_03785 [Candidatus Gottesmanbacteria bacterium CG11_big_fil_rev_8_21_14_0_20_37_11]|uniref:Glycosyl transferase family 1 domain-containing protein n=2 Tax=Candidatus Gottesmaniibacteriota TaxID=1752720 RepID=A0A2M7RQ84_9BACT|nr:MAG: hypothetical protein COX23_01020 [Candidatus Gottesmanbacteria bacterium CG23_combo_of_CG06-09_8_20_14_all_37_19]PIR08290.1 MAG: hypothetical protein COV53_03785 [Candidatus Gottesmanbacteria bacterium CG11_big_fil_rev_8_21_14_0_20_37_11]PIZ02189.1 MAG: hypothetical protein COY59_06205 [Candidatus Gottesmanbacteria bacterium CG_4_10_14_0_8_um_filter_37_24]